MSGAVSPWRSAPARLRAGGGGANQMCGIAAIGNRFGRISPTDAARARGTGRCGCAVLDGGPARSASSRRSLIFRATASHRSLRPGHITPEQIESVIGVLPELPSSMQVIVPHRGFPARWMRITPRLRPCVSCHRRCLAVLQELFDPRRFIRPAGLRAAARAGSAPTPCAAPASRRYARGLYAALRELRSGGQRGDRRRGDSRWSCGDREGPDAPRRIWFGWGLIQARSPGHHRHGRDAVGWAPLVISLRLMAR